ncbi:MAG: response regulator [Candidatus Cloacimonetes bacterium]|nr:response regulator [Candidatus Cloacimonadota bacterium]MBL7086797.1 response regulator [Candidatus Cloacimonadota bacterium]
MKKVKILWIDDEIEMLKPHILFLEERNYEVVPASNGNDGIKLVEENNFDLVLLDEMMPGLDGLETLSEIKKRNASLPVVMVTKNEEEGLMNKAISQQITDYIIKPINPNQVLMSIKKILMSEEIRRNRIGEEYTQFSAWLNQKLFSEPDWQDWVEIYRKIVDWDIKFDSIYYEDVTQMHNYEKKNCNVEFSNFISKNYTKFLNNKDYPILSYQLVKKYIAQKLSTKKLVYFIVLDCLRLDQFNIFKPFLEKLFNIKTDYYLSILPTSTPYSRNAIFSGLMPDKIAKIYPQCWKSSKDIESSFNRDEHFFIDEQIKRLGILLPNGSKYTKILNIDEGEYVVKKIPGYKKERLVILVYNFLDLLLHHRFKDEILQEIIQNNRALRSLSKIWFINSQFYRALQLISKQDAVIVLTTDHGSIKVEHATKVISDRDVSSGLRAKHGKNISCNERQIIKVTNPSDFGLPAETMVDNFIFAKGDYYFVYPTDYHEYKKKFAGTYQHGGVSMEEMILPISILTPKRK